MGNFAEISLEDSKQEFVKNNLVHSIFQLEKKGGNVKKAVLKIMAGLSTIGEKFL